MADIARLQALIEPVVHTAGYELVRVALITQPVLTLQVMVEDPATGQMLVDDCAALSRRLSVLLDEADPIPEEYMLEVSSPGIDRPLTRRKDYDRYAGHVARIELKEPLHVGGADRRRFQGHLLGLDGDAVRIAIDGLGEMRLPLAAIDRAKLVLTAALIAATQPLTSDGADEEIDDEETDGEEADAGATNGGIAN